MPMEIDDIPAEQLVNIDLNEWVGLCEWLNSVYRKCAYWREVPVQAWRDRVYIGGNSKGAKAHEERVAVGLVFYWEGWGWRLRKNWRIRLAQLWEAQKQAVLKLEAAHRWDGYPDDYDPAGVDLPF